MKNLGASAETLTLAGISGETFVSHESNALKKGAATVDVAAGTVALEVPAKSIVAVRLTADPGDVIDAIAKPIVRNDRRHNNQPMIFRDDYQIKVRGGEHFDNKIFRVNGKVVK